MSLPTYLGQRRSVKRDGRFRIVVMGSAMVGKSAIVDRFVHKTFNEDYQQTIEDMYSVNKRMIEVEILDTAGAYSFPAMHSLAIESGDAFILVFSVDIVNSFEKIKHIRRQIRHVHDRTTPIIVAANKIEMDDKFVYTVELDREVRLDWNCQFYEVSAKEDEGIDIMFADLVDWFVGGKRCDLLENRHVSVVGSKGALSLHTKKGERRRCVFRHLLCSSGNEQDL